MGTSVMEINREPIMANETVMASGVKRYFEIPVRKIIGKKTIMIVSVVTNTGIETSFAPSKAAFAAVFPCCKCLSMYMYEN